MDVEDDDASSLAGGAMHLPMSFTDQVKPGSSKRLSWSSWGRKGTDSDCTASHMAESWVPGLQPLFVDGEEMKKKVRDQLMKKTYTVTEFYKEQGFFQKIARSVWFEHVSLLVIGLNAIWIAYETDNNHASVLYRADLQFQVAELLFCSFFLLEWFIRFMAFEKKSNGLRDPWFTFDTLLVMLMVADTGVVTLIVALSTNTSGGGAGEPSVLRIVRLLRLTRMARMARLLRATPELMILVKGMVAALRSVFFTLCLLFIVLYVFAIALTQLSVDYPVTSEMYFGSVLDSMYSLLLHGAFADNLSIVANNVGQESYLVVALFIICVLLGAFTVMNLLIGVLCDVVSAVASVEREQIAVALVKEKMQGIVNQIDTDGNNMISKVEFQEIVENPDAVKALEEVDVDVCGLVDLAELIFEDDDIQRRMMPSEEQGGMMGQFESTGNKEISFENFMSMVLELRNTNNATVKDVMTLRRYDRQCFLRLSAQLDINNKLLAALAHSLKPLQRSSQRGRTRTCDGQKGGGGAERDGHQKSCKTGRHGTEGSPSPVTSFPPEDSSRQGRQGKDALGEGSKRHCFVEGPTPQTFQKVAVEDLPEIILEQAVPPMRPSRMSVRQGVPRVSTRPGIGLSTGGLPTNFEEQRERLEASMKRGLEELENLCGKLFTSGAPRGLAEHDVAVDGVQALQKSTAVAAAKSRQQSMMMPGVPDSSELVRARGGEPQHLRSAAAAGVVVAEPAELKDKVQRVGEALRSGLLQAQAMSGKRGQEAVRIDEDRCRTFGAEDPPMFVIDVSDL